jgi:hypothetical protein
MEELLHYNPIFLALIATLFTWLPVEAGKL